MGLPFGKRTSGARRPTNVTGQLSVTGTKVPV